MPDRARCYNSLVATRYLLTPPGETRPSLLVDLVVTVDDDTIGAARVAMFKLGCAHALVLDARRCVILRDTYASMDASSIQAEAEELETPRLLLRADGDLADHVERWLRSLAANWHAALPRESWVTPLLTDVVPAAAGSVVHRLAAA